MTAAEIFRQIGEPYAAGLFSCEERSLFYRHCAAQAAWFDAKNPTAYGGESLYPCGNAYLQTDCAMVPHYAKTYEYNDGRMARKLDDAALDDEDRACALQAVRAYCQEHYFPVGWLHGAPNYHRIVAEGLASYRERAKVSKGDQDFRDGVILLLDAMERYLCRCTDYLCSVGAPDALCRAMKRVPFQPAETYYEGLVCWNLIFYLDGCDNLGCLDRGLAHLYRGEDLTDVIGQLFANIDAVGMWSCTIGPDYNEITKQALYAIRGRRRPLLELRTTPDMPEELWRIAGEMLTSGATNPSFYNDRGIHDMMAEYLPKIREEDLPLFCGCGCTETNLEGLTRAGGTDADINLALIFEQYLHKNLTACKTFDDFYTGLCKTVRAEVNALLDRLTDAYLRCARTLPHPIRTLFTDDCIDRGKDYHAGGPRYTWTMNSNSGLINCIDSLAAVKQLVYEEQRYPAEEFLSLLSCEDPGFYAVLASCPCFGTDDAAVDALGADFTTQVYSVYKERGGVEFIDAFTLTEHQFSRYEGAGRAVGPTPDGRHAGDPTCDSVAALRGKAKKGPTAMLASAARLPQKLAMGMTVLNLTVAKHVAENPTLLRALVEGYFAQGGLQVQVTVTSADELRDAMEHPEAHEDLI
ncbi:MAG: hypothetical protein IKZ09_12545, partial [Clostridia bacterium]|nr:hypothetical protein [Clostridia bacterium]